MLSFILVLAVSAEQPRTAPLQPAPMSVTACTAQRLRPFVGPTGIHQPWPLIAELPPKFSSAFGELLSDQGIVADGYMHVLHVDASARTAYVVQQGGIAGFQTVYGPLPVAACSVSGAP